MMIVDRLLEWWGSRYVIADPNDNSITLSKSLFKAIGRMVDKNTQPKIFVFKVGNEYGFSINPTFEKETQLCNIQYNDKYKCVGFESLCPSVNKIFYDYGLEEDKPVWLSVKKEKLKELTYFKIKRPNEINIKRHKKARYYI